LRITIATQEAIIARLKNERKELKQKLKRLDEVSRKEEKPYFLWHIFFREIFDTPDGGEGFDIVIANPPYGVDVDKSVQLHYGLGNRDSYGVFMSMALQKLLKPAGHLCFIVSDTWLTISSHLNLRKQILDCHHLQKVIRLHADCFKATVNSCILTVKTAAANAKYNPTELKVLAADLTKLSTRKDVAEFRDKLFHLEEYLDTSTEDFAVFGYTQDLSKIIHDQPVLVASPKLFKEIFNKQEIVLTDVAGLSHKVEAWENSINSSKIRVSNLGRSYTKLDSKKVWKNDGLFQIVSGIKTGNNKKYLRYCKEEEKGLNQVDKSLIHDESKRLSEEEILEGIDSKRSFVPFEMGRASDVEEGTIPNYYQPETNFFIDWSKKSVKAMRSEPHSDLANPEFRFKHRISFSTTGIYAPTFRNSVAPIFVNKSSGIFIEDFNEQFLLGVLCSKVARFILKNFINHSVEMEVDDIKRLVIPISFSSEIVNKVSELVTSVVKKQEINIAYNFFENEQRLLDLLIYQLYKLNEHDIQEIESWFARRYPKLAKYAYVKPKEELVLEESKKVPVAERVRELVRQDESRNLEFKSSLRYDIKQIGVPHESIEHSVFKNIAAFLNSEGGIILIGVEDNKNIVGLEQTDYKTFSKDNKRDEFVKHFDQLIQNYFGDHVHHNLRLELASLDGKTVCMVEITEKAGDPVFLKQKNKPDEFYIRRFASAKALTVMETVNYIKEHWK
jgi:hypothetical protein